MFLALLLGAPDHVALGTGGLGTAEWLPAVSTTFQCPVIGYGSNTEGTINPTTEADCLDFEGIAGERVRVALLDFGGLTASVEVRRPDETLLCGPTVLDELNCVLDATGTHSVTVRSSGGTTGSYRLALLRLNDPVGCTALAYGTNALSAISVPAERDCYTIAGATGERVRAGVLDSGGLNALAELLRPNGTTLCGPTSLDELNCLLDGAGPHTLLIRGSGITTGPYRLALLRLNDPVGCTALAYGSNTASDITEPAERDCYTIAGGTGERLRAGVLDSGGLNALAELLRPDGTTLCGPTSLDELNCLLDGAGSHTLLIRGSGATTGAYRIALLRLNNPLGCTHVAFGTSTPGEIAQAAERDCYTFDGSATERIQVRVRDSGGLAALTEVVRPDGRTLCAPTSLEQANCTLDVTGRHMIVIRGSGATTGAYTMELICRDDCQTFHISSITPSRGGNAGTVTVEVRGGGFEDGAEVHLREGTSDVLAGQLTEVTLTRIRSTFDLRGQAARSLALAVRNPGGQSVSTPFVIDDGGEADLWVSLTGRARIRPGRESVFTVSYGNRGNVDGYLPLLTIAVPVAVPATLEPLAPPPSGLDPAQVPQHVDGGSERWYPLIVPRVAAGETRTLSLNVTPAELGRITVRAWISRSLPTPPPPIGGLAERRIAGSAQPGEEWIDRYGNLVEGIRPGARDAARDDIYEALREALRGVAGLSMASVWRCWSLLVRLGVPPPHALAGCAGLMALVASWALLEGYEAIASADVVTAIDPNEKVGPARWIAGGQGLTYTIFFENLATATAPAQEVVVTDSLDAATLDLATLELGEVGFGAHRVAVAAGAQDLSQTVDLRPQQDLLVRIEARLDPATGDLEWRLTAVDPATGQPPADPDVGFLPPNRNPPEGEGFVQLEVMPRTGLATGTELRNDASIVFDTNAPIATPEWLNTVDATAPASHVLALPAEHASGDFTVTWTGQDAGSGVRDFTILVSRDGGAPTPWLSNTSATSATYAGARDHAYAFSSVARDHVGNREARSPHPDATTRVVAMTSSGGGGDGTRQNKPPRSRIGRPKGVLRRRAVGRFTGTATDDNGVRRVELALVRRARACRHLTQRGTLARRRGCSPRIFLAARGTTRWTFVLERPLPKGRYVLSSRAIDDEGLREPAFVRGVSRVAFRLR